jgi:argininosuccinate lyase
MTIEFDLDVLRRETEERDGVSFPARSYAETILAPMYYDVQENLLEYMHLANKAHLIMLNNEKIISDSDAVSIKKAISEVCMKSLKKSTYTGKFEDLFFEVEDTLTQIGGTAVGNLHIARSRNDLGVALYRLALRDRLLELNDSATNFQRTLAAFAAEHTETYMIAHTHGQQAQPTTLGHYITGMVFAVNRDIRRLRSAYDCVNRSPLGAAAITTSGFAVNRETTCRLLGFDDVIENSYDSIGGGDFIGESATAIHLACINLSRLICDLMLWATQEFGYLKVASPYTQISSIMPQKRNPVAIEHSRSILSSASGDCLGVLNMLHNTPYGDIVDTEDDSQPGLWRALEKLSGIYKLLSNVIATLQVDKTQLLKRAEESFSVITELADTIVREESISFRQAHAVAHKLVSRCIDESTALTSVGIDMIREVFKSVTGRDMNAKQEDIMKSLSYANFVAVRKVSGGPEPNELKRSLQESALPKVRENIEWISAKSLSNKKSIEKLESSFLAL